MTTLDDFKKFLLDDIDELGLRDDGLAALLGEVYGALRGEAPEPYRGEAEGPLLHLNVYEMGRAYGGPEEGGWWYDTFTPEEEFVFGDETDALRAFWAYRAYLEARKKMRWEKRLTDLTARLEAGPAEYHDNWAPWE